MKQPLQRSLVAIGLAALTLVAAGCGDDDKKPTGPDGGKVDSRLVGLWKTEAGLQLALEEDGTFRTGIIGLLEFSGTWGVDDNLLILQGFGGTFRVSISGNTLSFEEIDTGISSLAAYTFTAASPSPQLTGTDWVDEDGDVLVFKEDGTFQWGLDFERGTWELEGDELSLTLSEAFVFTVSGDTLTFDEDTYTRQ